VTDRGRYPSIAGHQPYRKSDAQNRGGKSLMQLESTLTCPHCAHQTTEIMPTDACQFFYDCRNCGKRLKPKPGDCCVFCSYGSVPCPPMQAGNCCS
jgi:hypothetical protein